MNIILATAIAGFVGFIFMMQMNPNDKRTVNLLLCLWIITTGLYAYEMLEKMS